MGFLSIVSVLVISIVAYSAHNTVVAVALECVVLLAIVQLFISFSPPAWLRAVWAAHDNRALQRATDELLQYCIDETSLAERALTWAMRLGGADSGAIARADGALLASVGLTQSEAAALAAPASSQRLRDGDHDLISVPLPTGSAHGVLVLRVGPLSTLFGADDLARLEQYAASIALALARVRVEHDLAQRTVVNEAVLQAIGDMGEGILVRDERRVMYENDPYHTLSHRAGDIDLQTAARQEHHVDQGDGAPLFLETAVRHVEAVTGRLTVAMVRDITERKLYERATTEQARLLDLATDAIFVRSLGPQPVITYWSSGAERHYGFTANDAIGRDAQALLNSVYPMPLAEIEATLLRDGQWEGELVHHGRDGAVRVMASHWAVRRDGDGVADGILEVNRDITEERRGERIKEAQMGVSGAVSGADGVRDMAPAALAAIGTALDWDVAELWLLDSNRGRLRLVDTWIGPGCDASAFRAAGARLGLRPGQGLAGRTWQLGEAVHIPDVRNDSTCDRAAIATVAGLQSALSFPVRADDIVFGAVNLYATAHRTADRGVLQPLLELGRVIGEFVERRRTATALEESVERLERLAATDPLTGVSNRRAFEAALEALSGSNYALLAIDVDNLKPINDEYGHEAGDVVLQMVARALRSLARDSDFVARLGGDEFAIVLPETAQTEVESVAERMRAAMHAISVPFGAARISIGWSSAQPDTDPRDVWRSADQSLYAAKSSGRDRVVGESFSGAHTHLRTTPDDAALLRDVLTEERIGVVFQPIIDLASGQVFGYEALARPRGHGPSESVEHVFRAARRLGRIRDLDWLSRRAAVTEAVKLPGEPLLFLNVSAVAFLDPVHPVDQLLMLLRAADWAAERVVLEITEQEAVRDLAQFRLVVASHREHGIRFAIDDVGEGHSTIEMLAASNPEFIKIAGSLTTDLTDMGATSAVRAALAFARSSRALVIAEGIEDEQALGHLRALDVPLGQGFHLGRPAPAESIAVSLRARAS